jgi:hypothetical protein
MTTPSTAGPDTTIEALRQQITTLQTGHDTFRHDVRAEVLRQHFDGSWCLPGSQAVLNDLGLPPIAKAFNGRAQLSVRITKVDGAADYSEARNRVIHALDVACSDPGVEFVLDTVEPALNESVVRED